MSKSRPRSIGRCWSPRDSSTWPGTLARCRQAWKASAHWHGVAPDELATTRQIRQQRLSPAGLKPAQAVLQPAAPTHLRALRPRRGPPDRAADRTPAPGPRRRPCSRQHRRVQAVRAGPRLRLGKPSARGLRAGHQGRAAGGMGTAAARSRRGPRRADHRRLRCCRQVSRRSPRRSLQPGTGISKPRASARTTSWRSRSPTWRGTRS